MTTKAEIQLAGAEMDVYRIDRNRLLTIGADQVFLINKADRCYGPLLVWPRSFARGLVLAPGV